MKSIRRKRGKNRQLIRETFIAAAPSNQTPHSNFFPSLGFTEIKVTINQSRQNLFLFLPPHSLTHLFYFYVRKIKRMAATVIIQNSPKLWLIL